MRCTWYGLIPSIRCSPLPGSNTDALHCLTLTYAHIGYHSGYHRGYHIDSHIHAHPLPTSPARTPGGGEDE